MHQEKKWCRKIYFFFCFFSFQEKKASGASVNTTGGSGNEDKGAGGSGGDKDGGGTGDKKDSKKSVANTPQQGPSNNAMRILVLAQKGDWTACESALKALERNVVEELLKDGHKQPLAKISDTVSYLILDSDRIFFVVFF